MGTCSYCGTQFPKTKTTRKYCTSRCKTNACLDRKPRRIRAADVAALHELLEEDFLTVDLLLGRLRSILRPGERAVGRVAVPRLD